MEVPASQDLPLLHQLEVQSLPNSASALSGQGKYSYTAGKLTVRQANGTIHSVSGMTDEERDIWWTFPHHIIGKVVEIQAMQVLANGSLREGRFKAVRHDKNVSEID